MKVGREGKVLAGDLHRHHRVPMDFILVKILILVRVQSLDIHNMRASNLTIFSYMSTLLVPQTRRPAEL